MWHSLKGNMMKKVAVFSTSPHNEIIPFCRKAVSLSGIKSPEKSSGFTLSIDWKDRGTLFSDHLTFDNLHLGVSQVALTGLLPGRSPGGGHGSPLQCSWRRAWQATSTGEQRVGHD